MANRVDIPTNSLSGVSRINHELKYFMESAPTHLSLDNFDDSNIYRWVVNMKGVEGTLYEGETFKLEFQFTDAYPGVSPIVKFIPGHVPIHPHIYSNGHICLEILYSGYLPEITVVYICLCVNQMLNNNKNKSPPRGNDSYSHLYQHSNPKNSWWIYEDEY